MVDYFQESRAAIDARVDADMRQSAAALDVKDSRERVALACRLLADEGHARSLAGQVTVRVGDGTFWTNDFSSGLAGVSADTILRIDDRMQVVEGEGKPNPAIRFHLWIYDRRPDLASIIHTHPPAASALSMVGEELIVAHMDATMFYNDCAFLAEWPGVPIYNEEGRIISEALGDKRSILLAHHGLLTTGRSLDEALYLAIYLERACEMQLAASAVGAIRPIDPARAAEGHAFMSKPAMISTSVNYWLRQVRRRHPDALAVPAGR
ncbi:MAG TPA: aldolase [Steroidobacter sp.]|uniref:aldolase n=1 Tax=Steroidobacter sp. TaxID=1978227 RepID=UPI002ED81925